VYQGNHQATTINHNKQNPQINQEITFKSGNYHTTIVRVFTSIKATRQKISGAVGKRRLGRLPFSKIPTTPSSSYFETQPKLKNYSYQIFFSFSMNLVSTHEKPKPKGE
jgi:hypothetical protein